MDEANREIIDGGGRPLETVSEQLIKQIKKKSKQIDQLQHGEVVLKVQDGKAVWGEIKTAWKAADSNKREA